MGWTNYLVLKEQKIAFELGREASYYQIDNAIEDADRLKLIIKSNESEGLIDEPVKDLKLQSFIQILKIYLESSYFDFETLNKLFIYWFIDNGYVKELAIMHEEEFEKIRHEYKVIERKIDYES